MIRLLLSAAERLATSTPNTTREDQTRMRRNWTIGRLLGIPIDIDLSWIAMAVLLTAALATGFMERLFPLLDTRWKWSMAAVLCVLLFISILLHEVAHCWVAQKEQMQVDGISLFVFGGVAKLSSEPRSPVSEMKMAVAGPLMSLGVAGVAAALSWSLGLFTFLGEADEIFRYLARLNFFLAAFNLLPGFPLDGGRIFRALLWWSTNDLLTATRIASSAGQAFGLGLVALGCYLAVRSPATGLVQGFWFVLIGWFLGGGARLTKEQTVAYKLFARVPVCDIMNRAVEVIPSTVSVQEAVDGYFLRRPRPFFPVVDGSELKGMITLHRVRKLPREKWCEMCVSEAVESLPNREWVAADENGLVALKQLMGNGTTRLVVVRDGEVVGSLERADIRNYVHVRNILKV